MSVFRRAVRLFLVLAGLVLAGALGSALYFWRWLVHPPRQELWATPADLDLRHEDVVFPARDGLRLSGWFIHGQGEAAVKPVVVLVHGWPWNRLGETADSLLALISRSRPVDLLRLSHGLQQAGYHVFSFDLRNHGDSAAAPPVTFGLREVDDLLGALDYLASRTDVDQARIGVVGFSLGGNALLYALPHTERIRAAVAVQPTSLAHFAQRFAYDLVGPLSKLVLPLAELFYRASGGPPFPTIEPIFAATGAQARPVLFVQGTGDPWGSTDNVAQMVAATEGAVDPHYVETTDRYGGYEYVVNHPELLTRFFNEQFGRQE